MTRDLKYCCGFEDRDRHSSNSFWGFVTHQCMWGTNLALLWRKRINSLTIWYTISYRQLHQLSWERSEKYKVKVCLHYFSFSVLQASSSKSKSFQLLVLTNFDLWRWCVCVLMVWFKWALDRWRWSHAALPFDVRSAVKFSKNQIVLFHVIHMYHVVRASI